MFRTLAHLLANPTLASNNTATDPAGVFANSPLQLSRWLEEVFAAGGLLKYPPLTNLTLGDADVITNLRLPAGLLDDPLRSGIGASLTPPAPNFAAPPFLGKNVPLPWDHLIYAFLLENTGILEILGEVIRRYKVGETLATPSVRTLAWARTTEALFFRDPPSFSIFGVTSQLRPEGWMNRRNLYWRVFGRDLSHAPLGRPVEGQPWKRDVGAGVNARFFEVWEELLRQVAQGILNDRNQGGPNPTDRSYVAYLCRSLSEMLKLRRRGGLIAQEEFAYVSMLSWFHLTVESDTSVVVDLKAEAGAGGNAADRLKAIGARVGITPPRESRELFELAGLMSPLMWFIEAGAFDDEPAAEMLYRSNGVTQTPLLSDTMIRIIDLWQSATGSRIKDPTVVALGADNRRPAQPLRLPNPTPTASAPVFAAPANAAGPTAGVAPTSAGAPARR